MYAVKASPACTWLRFKSGRSCRRRQSRTQPRAHARDLAAEQPQSVPPLISRLLGGGSATVVPRVLSALLSTPTVPIGSYVASPRGLLHELDPRVKQAWLLAFLLLPGKLALPGKAVVCAVVTALSVAGLPRRVWTQQLSTLAALCGLLFLFTALGADSVPPLSQARLPTPGIDATLPAVHGAQLGGSTYSYILLRLGPLHVTRRGAAFAASACCLTFTLLQSARLVLCTTPPEGLAAGLAWAATPFRLIPRLRAPLDEAVLALLLALRFCALVFEEARNLALAVATRGVDWAALGPTGSLEAALALVARLLGALFANAAQIADAMRARGFRDVSQAKAALQYGAPLRIRPIQDGAALALLITVVVLVASGIGAR